MGRSLTWTTGWTGSRPPGSSSESQSELCTLALIDALFAPCPATCSLHSGTFSVFAYLKRTARHSVCSTAPAVSCPATRPTPSQLHFSHFARVLFVKRVSRSLLPDCTIAMCAAPAPSPAVGAWTSAGDAPCRLRARPAGACAGACVDAGAVWRGTVCFQSYQGLKTVLNQLP